MRRRPSLVRMGPISVFVLVVVLCLAVMGVLSATTAKATSALAQRQAAFAESEYQNEIAGQRLYAAADDVLAAVRAAGGTQQDALAALSAAQQELERATTAANAAPTVTCSLEGSRLKAHIESPNGRCLDVAFDVQNDATLRVVQWKATTLWTEDTAESLWVPGDSA